MSRGSSRRTVSVCVLAVVAMWITVFGFVVVRTRRSVGVTIRSCPPRATVFAPEGCLGITPVRIMLKPGEELRVRLVRRDCIDLRAVLRADDYMPTGLRENVELLLYGKEATAPIAKMKSALSARLSVTSEPVGAEVYLDGRRLGFAPLSRAGLTPGRHLLRVLKEGFAPKEQTVDLLPGRESSVHYDLESQWVMLYRQRMAKNPGVLTNHAELAHYYTLMGEFAAAEKALFEGLETMSKRTGVRDKSRFVGEMWQIYTRYFLYPAEGADDCLRPACRKIMQTVLEKGLYPKKHVQSLLKRMDAYDKKHPPTKK